MTNNSSLLLRAHLAELEQYFRSEYCDQYNEYKTDILDYTEAVFLAIEYSGISDSIEEQYILRGIYRKFRDWLYSAVGEAVMLGQLGGGQARAINEILQGIYRSIPIDSWR